MAIATPRPEMRAVWLTMITRTTPRMASETQTRGENPCPALIRFFQSNATTGWPAGFKANGSRLAHTSMRSAAIYIRPAKL